MLSNNGLSLCVYAYAARTVHFSTGGNFTELHALAARSYMPACPPYVHLPSYLPVYIPSYVPSYVPSCLPTHTYLSVTEKPLQVCCHLVLGVNQSSSLLPQLSALSTAQDSEYKKSVVVDTLWTGLIMST